jgi:CBS domain containing-hemolysin-like protein
MTGPALSVALLLTVAAASLRAAGASLVRTPRADALHDAAEGARGAEVVAGLLDDRPLLQPSLGMVHSGLMVAAAIPASWALTRLATGWVLLGGLFSLAVALVLLGDMLPRQYGRSHPRSLAYRFAGLLAVAMRFGSAAADLLSDVEEPEDEEEEDVGEERELISSVIEFTDTLVREVMVPRPDMITIPADAVTDAALGLVIEQGRSRIPLVGDGVDDIVGILYARDLLVLKNGEAGSRPCRLLAREAYFVPETKRVFELLREMQANKIHLAIVVDEFGGTAGLVTIEDLIEEIVGEIADEYDTEEPMIVAMEGGGYLIDARLDVDELGDLIGLEMPRDEWDTVGGFILGLAGRVPREGEMFDYDDYRLIADRVQGRRVSRIRLVHR